MSLNRLVDILLTEKEDFSEVEKTLKSFDSCILQFENLSEDHLLSHFKGQFYCACATLLVKKVNARKGADGNHLKHALLLYTLAYDADVSSQFWHEGGARKVFAGHMIQILEREGITVDPSTSNVGNELYQVVFPRTEVFPSCLIQHHELTIVNISPSSKAVLRHVHDYIAWHRGNLHMLVWLFDKYYNRGSTLCLPFAMPPWSSEASLICDLSSLDLNSFLYCVVYYQSWHREICDGVIRIPHDGPRMVSKAQDTWWSLAIQALGGVEIGAASYILKSGLDQIRCTPGSNELDIRLTIMLADTFAREARNSSAVVASKQDRAAMYYKSSLATIESIENGDFVMMGTGVCLFEPVANSPDLWEIGGMKQKASDFLAVYEIDKKSQSKYADIVEGLDDDIAAELEMNDHDEKDYNLIHRNDYHMWLFSKVEANKNRSGPAVVCNMFGSCGRSIQLPVFLICQVWSDLEGMLSHLHRLGVHKTIDIIVPDIDIDTLILLGDLLTQGRCQETNGVHELLATISLQLDVSKEVRGLDDPVMEHSFQNTIGNVMFEEESNAALVNENALFKQVENICSKSCLNNCIAMFHTWPKDNIKMLKEKFKCGRKIEIKNKLLNHLKSQRDIGMETASFIIKQHKFCRKALSHITDVSEYLLTLVLRDFHRNIQFYEHGNAGLLQQESAASIRAISWIKMFAENYGQASPEDNVTVLSYWLTKKSLYNMYTDESPGPYVSLSLFYTLFKEKFGPRRVDKSLPWIRISKYSTHSVCNICVALNNNQKQSKTESELKQAKALRNSHRQNFAAARRKIEEIKQSALSFPSDNLFIQIDGMDNNKSYLPRYLEHSKDQAQKERLPTKISGCNVYSGWYEAKRKVIFYVNHDIFEQGSNMIITLINLLLQDFIKDWKKLPKKLHLNMDNCWKDRIVKVPWTLLTIIKKNRGILPFLVFIQGYIFYLKIPHPIIPSVKLKGFKYNFTRYSV